MATKTFRIDISLPLPFNMAADEVRIWEDSVMRIYNDALAAAGFGEFQTIDIFDDEDEDFG
jgi:hypothetical protein